MTAIFEMKFVDPDKDLGICYCALDSFEENYRFVIIF